MKVEISVHGCGVSIHAPIAGCGHRESRITRGIGQRTPRFRAWVSALGRVEGVAAAAIERTRVCDHRKGVKTPSWRRRWMEEHVAEERGV